MQDLFSVPWEELTVEDVEAFLAEAGDEGLTWEAKGHELPRRASILKAVCGSDELTWRLLDSGGRAC